jgi:hypothetical protein
MWLRVGDNVTSICVLYVFVLVYRYVAAGRRQRHLYVCPHAPLYASSYCSICVFILFIGMRLQVGDNVTCLYVFVLVYRYVAAGRRQRHLYMCSICVRTGI